MSLLDVLVIPDPSRVELLNFNDGRSPQFPYA